MVRFLRAVSKKAKWDKDDENYSWLQKGDAPADILKDLISVKGELSVWRIEEDHEIAKVLTGIALGKDKLEHIDCVLWDENVLTENSFIIEDTDGETVYTKINYLHRSLIGLTAGKTAKLADLIWPLVELDRLDEIDLEDEIRAICTADWFNLDAINSAKVRAKIQQFIREKQE